VEISTGRAFAEAALLIVPLALGFAATAFLAEPASALVGAATCFVIVEITGKLIEFLQQGDEREDWFATAFEQVRVPCALASGSFAAGALLGAHPAAAIGGVFVYLLALVWTRIRKHRLLRSTRLWR